MRTRNRFGETLSLLREKADVSVAQLARQGGVSEDYVYKMIRGVSPPPNDSLIKSMSSVFGDDVSDELIMSAGRFPEDVERFVSLYPVFCVRVLRSLARLNRSGLAYVARRLESILSTLPSVEEESAATA